MDQKTKYLIEQLQRENQSLRMQLADTEALELGTAERLAASQAREAKLREAVEFPVALLCGYLFRDLEGEVPDLFIEFTNQVAVGDDECLTVKEVVARAIEALDAAKQWKEQ